METRPDIEEQINRAFNSVKNTESVELPFGFADKVMNKIHANERGRVRNMYTISPLLKVAAMVVLIVVNVFTIKLALNSGSQPAQSPAQYGTIKDFVNNYQMNDANEELLTVNTPNHE